MELQASFRLLHMKLEQKFEWDCSTVKEQSCVFFPHYLWSYYFSRYPVEIREVSTASEYFNWQSSLLFENLSFLVKVFNRRTCRQRQPHITYYTSSSPVINDRKSTRPQNLEQQVSTWMIKGFKALHLLLWFWLWYPLDGGCGATTFVRVGVSLRLCWPFARRLPLRGGRVCRVCGPTASSESVSSSLWRSVVAVL